MSRIGMWNWYVSFWPAVEVCDETGAPEGSITIKVVACSEYRDAVETARKPAMARLSGMYVKTDFYKTGERRSARGLALDVVSLLRAEEIDGIQER